MKRDYLSPVLPPERPAVRATELPDAETTTAADLEASALHQSLDMIRLSEDERAEVGPAATPEEMEIDRLYAEATEEVPSLLGRIRREPGALASGYEMQRALTVYRQANRSLLRTARTALVISAAELTAQNDRVEEAALVLTTDPTLPAERRAVISIGCQALAEVRARQIDATEQRQARRQRRDARTQTQLLLTEQRTEQRRRLAELGTAPLPETTT